MALPEFLPSNDTELETRVRSITAYEDTPKQLPSADFIEIRDQVKTDLYTEFGITSFYDDEGVVMALTYATAIEAKLQIENYSVSGWRVGDKSIHTQNVPPDESAQLQRWNAKVNTGLDNADVIETDDSAWQLTFDPGW